jgi:hypothetical protein
MTGEPYGLLLGRSAIISWLLAIIYSKSFFHISYCGYSIISLFLGNWVIDVRGWCRVRSIELTYYMVSRVIISISYPMVHAMEYYTGVSYKV